MAMPGNRRVVKYKEGQPLVELIRQPLYHMLEVQAATSQTLQFFSGVNPSNKLVTNLVTNGMLPTPHTFDIFGLSVVLEFGLNPDDWYRFYNNSFVNFKVSTKDYLTVPVHKIPASCGPVGIATTTKTDTTIFAVSNGWPAPGIWFPMDIDGISIHLPSNQDFSLTIQTLNTTAFTQAFKVWVYLDGILSQPVM